MDKTIMKGIGLLIMGAITTAFGLNWIDGSWLDTGILIAATVFGVRVGESGVRKIKAAQQGKQK